MKSRTTAVAVSIALHSLLVLIAILSKLTVGTGNATVSLTIGTADSRVTELLTIETDFAGPALALPEEKTVDVAFADFSEPLFDSDVFFPTQSGVRTAEGINSRRATTGSSDRGWPLTSYRVTAVLDASQNHSIGPADVSTKRPQALSRQDLRFEVAHEIARSNPGKIYSVAFIPMVDHVSAIGTDRRHLIEWVAQYRYDWTALEAVSPTPDVVILASTAEYPMQALRDIIGRSSEESPMLVLGLQLERSRASELKKLANDCGGTYFGVD